MGQHVHLAALDGHRVGAYVAAPDAPPRGGLVVVQEVFGLNSHIRGVADRWAKRGYLVVAPALFDRVAPGTELGYADEDLKRGRELRAQVGNDAALLDIAAARTHATQGGRCGVLGFCWGGLLTWLAAGRIDGFEAAVCYYGAGIPDHAALVPRCPVLAHFGERDHFIPVEGARAFAQARPEVEVHLYPADHGFNCDQRGAYDAPSAALAQRRSEDFLARHLG